MKKEVIWFPIILVLVALSVFVIITHQTRYGLDINGGIRAVLQMQPKPGQAVPDSDTVQRILENRLNSSGVAEPVIIPKGSTQFIVEPPNVRNKDAIIQELQTTAEMEFVWFKDVYDDQNTQESPGSFRYTQSVTQDAKGDSEYSFLDHSTGQTFRDQAQIISDFQSKILSNSSQRAGAAATSVSAPLNQYAPQGQTLYLDKTQQATLNSLNTELTAWNNFYNLELQASGTYATPPAPGPIVAGAHVKPNATAQLGGSTGMPTPVVNVELDDTGATAMGNFTRDHVGSLMAILLDGRVLSSDNVAGEFSGTFQITGFPTLAEATDLANLINAGALPVPLSIQQVTSVEATLGHSAVHDMIIAGLIGLGLVLLFMASYYLLPGLVADVALLFYAIFALAIFKGALSWFIPQVTLTLPGIAGFILSVGMAVDANILIFERTKEELRNGKALRAAVDSGFKRAFTAIRDSNICTLITCVILASMGEPSVKGFAITLGIGVVVSLFTAVTVTRTMLYLLVDLGLGKNPALFGLKRQWITGSRASETGPGTLANDGAGKPAVNVIGNRKFFYAISLLIIVPGIIFFCLGGLKESIEFKGGTQVEAVFQQPVSQETIRKAVLAAGYKDNLIQMAEGGDIAIVSVANQSPTGYLGVEKALTDAGLSYTLQSHSLVGPQISAELTRNAFQAVVIAALLIVIYMASVFSIGGFTAGLRFGTSAIIALLHDVLVLIGSFSILGYFLDWQIDSLFVTAVLTVVGFSVHDTIVIFDRLRENLHRRLKSDSFEDLANRSILQSFARSINTSFTVILTLCALLIFGEPSTRLLDVALLIGIVSGTYSSIFNATPILVDWENWLARRQGMAKATTEAVAAGVGALPKTAPVRNGESLYGANRTTDTAPEEPRVVKTVDTTGNGVAGRPGVSKSKKKTIRRF